MYVEVTIGWTRSDRANGYSSHDGYRPGASQHTETIVVTLDQSVADFVRDVPGTVERIAEAAFAATNHPYPEGLTGLDGQVYTAIRATGYNGRGAHYSLSVGDTVSIAEVMLACDSIGWRRVTDHTPVSESSDTSTKKE
jgi:hypothetical protein